MTNTPGVLDEAVADHCVGLVLAAGRRIAEGDRLVRDGGWTGFSTDLLLGLDLAGATAGLVGVGGVGSAVATRLVQGFGMRGVYLARRRHPELEDRLGIAPATLDALLEEADVITLHVPLTPETRGMIGAAELARMRPGAVLVNVSRGPVVDEDALVEALREGRISAGLDVFADEPLPAGHPLTALPNAVLTPHIASAGRLTRRRMAHLAVDNLLAMAARPDPTVTGGPLSAGGARGARSPTLAAVPTPVSATLHTDPGCPWAYSALPALRVLEWRYGDEIEWRLVVIGLRETPPQYVAGGYTTDDRALGWMEFRDRFGMPFAPSPKARVVGDRPRLPGDRRRPPAAPGSEWAVLRALQLANFTLPLLLDDEDARRGRARRRGGRGRRRRHRARSTTPR